MTSKQDPKNSPDQASKSDSAKVRTDSTESSSAGHKTSVTTSEAKESGKATATSNKKSTKKVTTQHDRGTRKAAQPASGRGLAMLALLLSLLAIAYGYWQGIQTSENNLTRFAKTSNENQRLQAELEKLQVALEAMGGKIVGEDIIQPKLDKLSARIDADTSTLAHNADFLTALQARITSLEKTYGSLEDRQQISENALSSLSLNKQATDRDVALSEVTFLIRAAAQRLQVFNDRDAALGLLQLADRQLASMDRRLFAPVRGRIQEDILALKAIAVPDLVAITGQLLALEKSVGQWRVHLPERSSSEATNSTDGGSDLMAKFKYMVNSLVTIREDEGTDEFLTLSQAERVKDRIRLELQAARVAALSAQQSNYLASIERVSNWLREYFDPSVATNAVALNNLDKLAGYNLKPQWPDLSPLLSLTRQLQSSQQSGEPPIPVAEPKQQIDESKSAAVDSAAEGSDS